MDRIPLTIEFVDAPSARANVLAFDLKRVIEDAHPDARAEQVRKSTETMDLGATLAAVLGTAAVTAVARGIQRWLEKHRDAEIEIYKDGQLLTKASGISGSDATRLAALMTGGPEGAA